MFPHHQGGGRNSSALQIKQKGVSRQRRSLLGDKQGVGLSRGGTRSRVGKRGTAALSRPERGRGLGVSRGQVPHVLCPSVQVLLTPPPRAHAKPRGAPHPARGKDDSWRRCLIPSAEQAARPGEGRREGVRGPENRRSQREAWHSGWPQRGKSRLRCKNIDRLPFHLFSRLAPHSRVCRQPTDEEPGRGGAGGLGGPPAHLLT